MSKSKKLPSVALFSSSTLEFLKKAGRQKNPNWLDRNREEYEKVLQAPLQHLAEHLSREVSSLAPDYHFPKRGLGRIKRSANRVADSGGGHFKNWTSYSASRPRVLRFEHNPNLYFLLNCDDQDDPILVAGGLYMPSSQQTRILRETIAHDASAFDRLFKKKEFAKRFPGGFCDEKKATRPPRGFDLEHPRMNWLKLQAFYVWRPYTKKEFVSKDFASLVAQDWKLILQLNRVLEDALQKRIAVRSPSPKKSANALLDKLQDISVPSGPSSPSRKMDF